MHRFAQVCPSGVSIVGGAEIRAKCISRCCERAVKPARNARAHFSRGTLVKDVREIKLRSAVAAVVARGQDERVVLSSTEHARKVGTFEDGRGAYINELA